MEKEGGVEPIRFIIPGVPPSSNSNYQVIWSQKRTILKPEVLLWKTRAKEYIPLWEPNDGDKVEVSVEVHQDWFYRNGKLKKADVANMHKALIDTICEKQGWDDSQAWYVSFAKCQCSFEEKTIVELKVIP
ncbi:crossover junction endodeoxyribonuclease rusA [Caudoviricetes sp.]|nr:crossover junction endodeoxyribonuclease rusA [Caudoviricetes sp.]UOF81010.1 crossover junction endodeoxyribonuclease rusA [Caudoviricetes sp.]UOF81406.1 crossover junction endodeoxyribonuclease rusA [Caudoviricetes sp.]